MNINWTEIIKAHEDEIWDAMREAVRKSYKFGAPGIVDISESGSVDIWIDSNYSFDDTRVEVGERMSASGEKHFVIANTGVNPEWGLNTDWDEENVLALFEEKMAPEELGKYLAYKAQLEAENYYHPYFELEEWVRKNAPKAYDVAEDTIISAIIDNWDEESETYNKWLEEALEVTQTIIPQ